MASIRGEPRTFNRYANRDTFTDLFALLTQAKLVRINRQSQALEPWLAESWTTSPDGLTYTLKLREGVTFSDGAPFTSDDVLFAFEAVADPKTASPIADSLLVGGKPLGVSAPDPATVQITFPSAYGPGLRILDNLPILPKHRLQAARDQGTLASAWGVTAPPAEMAGLGPFVLSGYQPGERVVFERNRRYWRRDVGGEPLPRLDRLTLEIVADQNAELLRLQAGQLDLMQNELRAEDYLPIKQAASAGRLSLVDVGIGLDPDVIWFSLKPELKRRDPRQAWLLSEAFRHAVSLAIDRRRFVDTVFLGAGLPVTGPVTPSNTGWFDPDLPAQPYDVTRARDLLTGLGLEDRDHDGTLDDRQGRAVRFALLAIKGNTVAERGAAVVRDDLAKIGVRVDVVALELGAFFDRLVKGDFDALYYRLLITDTDPAVNLDFWLSSGSAHIWNIGQSKPATAWEAQIDGLMLRQAAAIDLAERRRVFNQVQRILLDHMPGVYLAAPRIYVATSPRVDHATPALLRPPLLWNADMLGRRGGRAAAN